MSPLGYCGWYWRWREDIDDSDEERALCGFEQEMSDVFHWAVYDNIVGSLLSMHAWWNIHLAQMLILRRTMMYRHVCTLNYFQQCLTQSKHPDELQPRGDCMDFALRRSCD